jgi:protein TonB
MTATTAFGGRPGSAPKRYLPLLLGLGLGLPLLGLALNLLFTKSPAGPHKMVTQITLVTPPPPKPEIKPPDPPKMKEEVKIEQPKPEEAPKPDNAPPAAGPLGLDAQGTGPGDGFGLAGRPGGHDITLGDGGGNRLGLTVFGTSTARHIAQELARDPRLKASSYQIEVRVWLGADGRFEREELVRGTGNRELDDLIRDGLRQVSALQQALPPNLPQPLRIRVTSSDA